MIQEWSLGDIAIKALKSLRYFHFLNTFYFPYSVLLSPFKILMANLDRKRFDF